MTDENTTTGDSVSDADTTADVAAAPYAAADGTQDAARHYGVGPLSIREVALLGVWALSFLVSFFPIYGRLGMGSSVWTAGIDWVLTIGAPTVAVFLIVLRRLSPQGIRRVGSLGIDQFASVAFSVSALIWLGIVWGAFVALAQTRFFLATWVVWVELVLMLAGVVLTVGAPHLPVLREDFRQRAEQVAHPAARPARPVDPRPARPVVHHSAPAPTSTGAVSVVTTDAGAEPVVEPVGVEPAPVTQAFWALAPEERDVLDEQGAVLFRIGPAAWALVIEDRDGVFVVRHEDGRVGYLHETAGVTRG